MEQTRQQKIVRLLQKDLGNLFIQYAKKNMPGTLISVSEVRISPDLSIAHVYLSIYPTANQQSTFAKISDDTSKIRGEIGTMERNQLRIIPELNFHIDETIDKMERIDQLLAKG